MKKFGLGRGLSALIPEEEEKESDIKLVSPDKIKPNPYQPRREFKEIELQELVSSIKERGIIQPLIVRKIDNDDYELIVGERRLRAAKIAQIPEIPVIIRDCSEEDLLQLSLIENLQRENLNPVEEAKSYEVLTSKFLLTQEEVAKKIGKSRPEVANTLRLLNLPDFILQGIRDGKITAGHGRCLLSLSSEDIQNKIYYQIVLKKLSVRETEEMVKEKTAEGGKQKRKKKPEAIFVSDVVEKLSGFLGTKVKISGSGKKGKIYIDYYSSEDLERIIDILIK